MPTYGDETLHDRYAREHADNMARLAKLPPEQIAEMELDLHNALAEVDRLRAQLPSQGGEAVEEVASIAVDAEGVVRDFTLEPGLDRHPGGYTVTPLMTVAQHQRILAAATHPANQVAEGVVVSRELLEQIAVELEHDNDRYFLGRELRALLTKP